MKRRRHGKRCGLAHSSVRRCRCVCGGAEHGKQRPPEGLLKIAAEMAAVPVDPEKKRRVLKNALHSARYGTHANIKDLT